MAVVLWFLAAMSLLVSGIVYEARADVKLAQLHSARAKAEAAGDGAIHVAMAALTSGNETLEGDYIPRGRFIVGGQAVEVSILPIAGLIDLNYASLEMLQALFQFGVGMDALDAQAMASSLVLARRVRLVSPEDFLAIEGANRAMYDAIKDSVRVTATQTGKLDLRSSPDSVLEIVAAQDPERLAAAEQRSLSGMSKNNKSNAKGDFRVDALVTVGDKVWLRRRWVTTDGAGAGSLPWKISRSEATRVAFSG
mgnify:FL=1